MLKCKISDTYVFKMGIKYQVFGKKSNWNFHTHVHTHTHRDRHIHAQIHAQTETYISRHIADIYYRHYSKYQRHNTTFTIR